MKILTFDFNDEFVWITVEGKNEGEEYMVICCLTDNKQIIEKDDCGHNWGSCGETNEEAFEYWGQNRCMTALFARAKKEGFEII
jgi:hypothetical protein